MKLIDTHAHLTSAPLMDQLSAVLDRAATAGIGKIICVGTTPADSSSVLALSQKYENIFAVIGIHPDVADQFDSVELLRPYLDSPKLLALGETGLDYHYDSSGRKNQQNLFAAHLQLAGETGLPVVVHCREAFDDIFSIIRSALPAVRGVFHCFSGDVEQMKRVLDLGWFLSFSGTVTFKNAKSLRDVAMIVPRDRFVIETDCPYLSPEPVRKIRLNEPAHLSHIAVFLANILKLSIEEFVTVTSENAVKLFGKKLMEI
jgi:TatD DNase family protein